MTEILLYTVLAFVLAGAVIGALGFLWMALTALADLQHLWGEDETRRED